MWVLTKVAGYRSLAMGVTAMAPPVDSGCPDAFTRAGVGALAVLPLKLDWLMLSSDAESTALAMEKEIPPPDRIARLSLKALLLTSIRARLVGTDAEPKWVG